MSDAGGGGAAAEQLALLMRQRGDDLRRAAEASRMRAKLHREQAALEAARSQHAVQVHRHSPQRSPKRVVRTFDAAPSHAVVAGSTAKARAASPTPASTAASLTRPPAGGYVHLQSAPVPPTMPPSSYGGSPPRAASPPMRHPAATEHHLRGDASATVLFGGIEFPSVPSEPASTDLDAAPVARGRRPAAAAAPRKGAAPRSAASDADAMVLPRRTGSGARMPEPRSRSGTAGQRSSAWNATPREAPLRRESGYTTHESHSTAPLVRKVSRAARGKREKEANGKPAAVGMDVGDLEALLSKGVLGDVMRRLTEVERQHDDVRRKEEERTKADEEDRLRRLETDNAVLREQIKALLRMHPLVAQLDPAAAPPPPLSPASHAPHDSSPCPPRGSTLTPPPPSRDIEPDDPPASVSVAAAVALLEGAEAAGRETVEALAAYSLKALSALGGSIALRLRVFEEAAFVCQNSLARLEDAMASSFLTAPQSPAPYTSAPSDARLISTLEHPPGCSQRLSGSAFHPPTHTPRGGRSLKSQRSTAPAGEPPTPPQTPGRMPSTGVNFSRQISGAQLVESVTEVPLAVTDRHRMLERLREVETEARMTEQRNAELRAELTAAETPNPSTFPQLSFGPGTS